MAGQDRHGTAAATAAEAFPERATTAVLAAGEGFADALAGGDFEAFSNWLQLVVPEP